MFTRKHIENQFEEAEGANPHTRHLIYLKIIAQLLFLSVFKKSE